MFLKYMISGDVPSHEMILELEKQLTNIKITNWIYHDLFSLQWWLLLVVLFIPWIVWWKYVDKKRLIEITFLGSIVLIIASYLDAVMSDLGLWSYNYVVIPLWHRMISADFSVLPVSYMFIYQYFQEWKRFLFAMVILSAIFAFVGEPFLQWLDIYKLEGWKHVYSFPIYISLGIFVKWFVRMLLARSIR